MLLTLIAKLVSSWYRLIEHMQLVSHTGRCFAGGDRWEASEW